MMNRKSWIYTASLVISSLAVVLLASRGTVQSVINEGDVKLSVSSEEYQGDETITLHAVLEFADLEQASIEEVELTFTDNSPIDLNVRIPMPLNEGTVTLGLDDGADGFNSVIASIRFVNVSQIDNPGPTPTPRTFKGISEGARIEIDVDWNPNQDALPIIGDYTAMLSVQLVELPTGRQSQPVSFSIVPVTLEIIALSEITPNTELEASVRADRVRNMGNASLTVLYDEATLQFIEARSEVCSSTYSLNTHGEVTTEFHCDPLASGEQFELARLTFKTISTIEPLHTQFILEGVSIENQDSETIPVQTISEASVTIAPACGDLDGDGIQTISDANAMLEFITGGVKFNVNQMIVGNLDNKNGVTVVDSVALLKGVASTNQTFGECGE